MLPIINMLSYLAITLWASLAAMEADTETSNRTKAWSEGRGFAVYEVSFDSFLSSDVALGNVFSSGLSL